MKKFYLQISALILIMGVSYPAFAVLCDINAEALIFGNYNAYSSNPNDSLCNITYHCTGINTNYTKVVITLTRGVSNSYNRFFYDKNNSAVLYNLYLDPQRTMVWGDGTENTAIYSAPIVLDTLQTVPVYGRIFPQQKIRIGTYSAPIMASIELQ